MARTHTYETTTTWRGNRGEGTRDYRSYARDHDTVAAGRPVLQGSSDAAFRGDGARWNPELLLVAALSQCHLLQYLHRCALNGVVVTAYVDAAVGVRAAAADGGGRFDRVVLRPKVTVAAEDMVARGAELHAEAARLCFIAASVNFPVDHEPEVRAATGPAAAEG